MKIQRKKKKRGVQVFEDVYETLLAEIVHPRHSRSIITISGMGGSGKTALAKNIYDSVGVLGHFDVLAWVRVPQLLNRPSDKQALFINLIESFQSGKNKKVDLALDFKGDLAGNSLRQYRYLVVIDNLWQFDVWRTLKTAFEDNNKGSRVIITTRSKSVATQDESFSHHELRFMTPQESWGLLCKKFVLGKHEKLVFSPAKEILAKEMLHKCNGLPLAVVVLAGLLSKDTGIEAWYNTKEHMWEQLKSASVEINGVFSLSYTTLSEELQCCFLYMAMFPEGFQFDTEKLKSLWTAEGFAVSNHVAEVFLHELVNCNLIQVSGTLWEKIAKCKLHDLVHNLASEKAKEINFYGVFHPYLHHARSIPQKRLAIHGPLQRYVPVSHIKTHVSTLLFFKTHREYFTEIEQLCAKLMSYSKLEVLDLKDINLGSRIELTTMLGKMEGIKFLGLANTWVREIPSTIGMLTELQTLEAGGKYKCRLPKELSKLKKLRHLLGRFEGPLPIQGLELDTLKIVDSDQMHALNTCKNINELAICCNKEGNTSTLDLLNCETLETLTVISSHGFVPPLKRLEKCSHLKRLWIHGALKETPKLFNVSSSLTSLILSNSRLSHDPMETLEKLPWLSNLELKNAYNGNKIVCHQNRFVQLEILRLTELYELEEWVVEEGAMPKLRGLGIFECYRLKMPEKLKSVPQVLESETHYYLQKMINGL